MFKYYYLLKSQVILIMMINKNVNDNDKVKTDANEKTKITKR